MRLSSVRNEELLLIVVYVAYVMLVAYVILVVYDIYVNVVSSLLFFKNSRMHEFMVVFYKYIDVSKSSKIISFA